LPTEVLIKKKLAFYKEKQRRLGGDEKRFAECIRISPAEELAIFWNTHTRISPSVAEAHIQTWTALSPPVLIDSPYISNTKSPSTPSPATPDLDTPDELALRLLLLGIVHRSLGCVGIRRRNTVPLAEPVSSSSSLVEMPSSADTNESTASVTTSTSSFSKSDADLNRYVENTSASLRASRELLTAAHALQPSIKVSTWIGGVAMFELAVLDLKEVEVEEKKERKDQKGTTSSSMLSTDLKQKWATALKSARAKLDAAMALAPNSVDLSSRLDSRVAMLRDEIGMKATMIDVTL